MNVLYQDDALLLIDKPAGMPVLPDGWDADTPYLVKLLEGPFSKLWVVHRLDKVTSGVMVLARTADAHRALNMQFERREAQKVYHAICVGAPAWDEHTARHKLRINVGHSHRTAVDNSHGKPAETHFKVLKRFKGPAPVGGYGLLECRPATGRTHQIRVHAYALGHPLVGDILYSAPLDSRHFTRARPLSDADRLIARPALHAFSLSISHPVTNEPLTFEAPYPADFAAALSRLKQE
jgi:RluA family pseudouridine synthase